MVKYADTTDSWLPGEIFCYRKSATVPQWRLSRMSVYSASDFWLT